MNRIVRCALSILAILVLATVSLRQINGTTNAQSTDCTTNRKVQVTDTIINSGRHNVWLLAKREGQATAKPFVQVENGRCVEFTAPGGTGWEWVSGQGSPFTAELMAGERTVSVSIAEGNLLIDKVLVTNDLSCRPQGTGENCITERLDFELVGVSAGQVYGERVIQANVFSGNTNGTVVEFYIDGQLRTRDQTAPYCLSGGANDQTCGTFNINSLSNGRHTLRVTVTSGGQTTERSVAFEVVAPGQAAPIPERDNEVNDAAKPRLTVNVSGITAGDTVTGKRKIETTVSGTTKPVIVRYKVDSTRLADRSRTPYCLEENSSGSCAEWDSSSIPNGARNFYVIATAEGFQETWVTMPVTFNNAATVAGATTTKDVTVGKPNQQVSGVVTVNIDKRKLQPGTKTIITLNNKKVGEVLGASVSSAVIDTSEVPNGNHTLSASIVQPDGSVEVVQSTVAVRNDGITSTASWLKENWLRGLLTVGAFAALTVGALTYLSHRRRSNALRKQHNISEEYTYKQPREKLILRTVALNGAAVLVVACGAVLMLNRVTTTNAATGLGFIAEAERGVVANEFSQGEEDGMVRVFIRMTAGQTSQPSTPTTPTQPTTPTTPATPTTPTTPSTPVIPPSTGIGPLPAPAVGLSRGGTIPLGGETIQRPSGDGTGNFRIACRYSHFNYDDAIVHPNNPGRAHLHVYVGNTASNAFLTGANIRSIGNSTCDGGTSNRSSYWMPALLDRNNNPVMLRGASIYYKSGYQGALPPSRVNANPLPVGLKIVAGNASASSPQERVGWECSSPSQRSSSIPSDCRGNLRASVIFPQCWDGVNLDSPNHISHLRYGLGEQAGTCPSSHPYVLPEITIHFDYDVSSIGSAGLRLSSDMYSGPGGYSLHADFFSGWDPAISSQWINNCTRQNADCHVGIINDREKLVF